MSVFVNPLKSNKVKFREEAQIQIQNHKKAVMYLEAAIKNHTEAVKYHEEGNHELAILSAMKAHNNTEMAVEKQKN